MVGHIPRTKSVREADALAGVLILKPPRRVRDNAPYQIGNRGALGITRPTKLERICNCLKVKR